MQEQWTPLHLAAYNGHNLTVETLIKCGAKVNAVEVVSNTFTCIYIHTETLQHNAHCFVLFILGAMDFSTSSCTKWSLFSS